MKRYTYYGELVSNAERVTFKSSILYHTGDLAFEPKIGWMTIL